jgi:hypothetical protein
MQLGDGRLEGFEIMPFADGTFPTGDQVRVVR